MANGRIVRDKRTRDCTRNYVAERLSITGALTTENRYRGIYAARFFVAALQVEGRFDVPVTPVPPNVNRVGRAAVDGRGARRSWNTQLTRCFVERQ